jgi:hypothetical protein
MIIIIVVPFFLPEQEDPTAWMEEERTILQDQCHQLSWAANIMAHF